MKGVFMDNGGGSESGITSKTALCLAAITMVGIDGDFKEEELDKLRSLIKADEQAFLTAFTFYNSHSLEVCIKTVTGKLTEPQKQITFHILHDLAYADSEFGYLERELIRQYAREFGMKSESIDYFPQSISRSYDLSIFKD